MSRALVVTAVLIATRALAIEPLGYIKESAGAPSSLGPGCVLEENLTGDCANYHWYNLCSGYIWIYKYSPDHGGVRFDDPCVVPGNSIDRAITYFRDTVQGYGQTVDIFLDVDTNNDGCPEYVLTDDLDLEPAERWNCSDAGHACIPEDAAAIIIRFGNISGASPTVAMDGPFTQNCDPVGADHSYYYGYDGSACIPWRQLSPTGRGDNFLFWLIVDQGCPTTAAEGASWGRIKGLYQ